MADGNIAAMREALKRVLAAYKSGAIHTCAECYRDEWDDELGDLKATVDAALAAPPRNCDRFKTMEAARAAFRKFCRENYHSSYAAAGLDGCDDCELCDTKNMSGEDACPFAWLFATEGGAE